MVDMEDTLLTQSLNHQRLEDNDPKWIARRQFQEIVLSFFKEHTMAYINGAFVNKQGIGLDTYKQVMENIFVAKLNGSPQYNEL